MKHTIINKYANKYKEGLLSDVDILNEFFNDVIKNDIIKLEGNEYLWKKVNEDADIDLFCHMQIGNMQRHILIEYFEWLNVTSDDTIEEICKELHNILKRIQHDIDYIRSSIK